MPEAIPIAIGVAASFALGAIASLFTSGPKKGTEARKGRKQVIRSSVEEHQIIYGTSMESGPLAFITEAGTDREFLHMVLNLAAHEVESFGSVWINDEEVTSGQLDGSGNVTSGKYAGFLRIRKFLGTDDQTADGLLVSEVAVWTTAHRGRGIAHIDLRFTWDLDVYPQGIPNVRVIVEGRKVWDPRTDPGDPSVRSFSNNAALCQLDYVMSDFGFEAPLSEIHEASWIAAANSCDENVTLKAGGTQKRYTCDGSFQVDQKPLAIMEDLLSASAGAMTYQQGTFRGYVGEATAATGTLDEGDLRGAFDVVPRPSLSDTFNAIRGTYINANDSKAPYTLTDFPPITNATFQAEDNNERIFTEIELPFTTNVIRAQRIANLFLLRSRQGIVASFPVKLSKIDIAVWDVITVSLAVIGWTDKEFRVLEWSLSDDGGIDLVLQEEAADIYDWDFNDEITVDPAPDTDFPDPFTSKPPGAPELSETTYQTREGGGIKAKAVLTWAPNDDAFLSEYQAEYRLTTASDWTPLPRTTDTTIDILDIAPGLYDFRVKALNTLGVSSTYATSTSREVFGLLAPPLAPTNLTISAVGGIALLRWDRHPELDVRIGGKIAFRHSQAQSGATWQTSASIGDPVDGADTVTALPLKPGTYLAKAIDSSSVSSANAVSATTKGAQVLEFANLDTINAHPLFLGIHNGTVHDQTIGVLKLAGVRQFDDFSNFDLLPDLDSWGGITPSGTYDFAAGIDLGSVKLLRLQSSVTVSIVYTLDQIDDRASNIDDWEDFDGPVTASGDIQVWVRETDDDPGGSPTWSSWQRLDTAEYQARGFDFQARLSIDDPAYNIHVSELTITADEVV